MKTTKMKRTKDPSPLKTSGLGQNLVQTTNLQSSGNQRLRTDLGIVVVGVVVAVPVVVSSVALHRRLRALDRRGHPFHRSDLVAVVVAVVEVVEMHEQKGALPQRIAERSRKDRERSGCDGDGGVDVRDDARGDIDVRSYDYEVGAIVRSASAVHLHHIGRKGRASLGLPTLRRPLQQL